MITEIDVKAMPRSMVYELSMTSPMPMVTITKTVDITRLLRLSKKHKLKFNSLFCYAILKAASSIEEFYTKPMIDKLLKYDTLRISVAVNTKNGAVDVAGIPYCEDFELFNRTYLENTAQVYESCHGYGLDGEFARIGTSAIVGTEIDSLVNFYCPELINPFLAWGKYRKNGLFKYTLPVSFHFHHAQMDGGHVARFFNNLSAVIKVIKI